MTGTWVFLISFHHFKYPFVSIRILAYRNSWHLDICGYCITNVRSSNCTSLAFGFPLKLVKKVVWAKLCDVAVTVIDSKEVLRIKNFCAYSWRNSMVPIRSHMDCKRVQESKLSFKWWNQKQRHTKICRLFIKRGTWHFNSGQFVAKYINVKRSWMCVSYRQSTPTEICQNEDRWRHRGFFFLTGPPH